MAQFGSRGDRIERLRRWLFWVLVLGLVGTQTELLLLEHYEDPWQFVPLLLIAAAIAVLSWHAIRRNAGSLRIFRFVMYAFVLAGMVGVGMHFRGAAEFQLEMDPAMSGWELVKKAMRVQAPPVLAPGIMLQLGLIGLVYASTDVQAKKEKML